MSVAGVLEGLKELRAAPYAAGSQTVAAHGQLQNESAVQLDHQRLLAADGSAALIAGAREERADQLFAQSWIADHADAAKLQRGNMASDLQGVSQLFLATQSVAVEADTLEKAQGAVHLGSHKGAAHVFDLIDRAAHGDGIAQHGRGAAQAGLGGVFANRAKLCAKELGVDSKEVSKAIAELKKEGKIMSPKRCYYAPAE